MKEIFSFPQELQATFDLLVLTRKRLEADMHAGLADKGGYNEKHMAALEKLSVAQAKLGTEMRQWSGHAKSSMDKMPPAQKARVVLQFIQTELPRGPRQDLYEVLAQEESKRPDGIQISIGTRPGPDVE